MSILQRIDYKLKGQERTFDLAGVDLFVGPNGSGKTTALLAITAGLRGLAESPGDAVKPYIGPDREGSAELTFDTGVVFRDLSKTRGEAATRANVDAERIAGKHLVRWDLGDFSTATESNREALLRQVLGSRNASDLVLPATPLQAELLKAVPITGDAGAWLDKALGWTRATFTEANAANKTAKEGAEAAQQVLGDAPPGMLSTAKETAERLEREIAGLRGEATSARREADAAQKAEGRRQRDAVRCDALEKQLRDLETFLAVPPEAPPDVAALQKAHVEARTTLDAARAAEKPLRGDLALATASRDGAAASVAALESLAAKAPVCAHCGGADPLNLTPQIESARAYLETTGWAVEDASADLAIAERKVTKAADVLSAAAHQLMEAEMESRRISALSDERAKKTARKAEIEAEMEQIRDDMAAPTAAPATFGAAELLTSLEEELQAARKTIDLHTRHAERGRRHQEAVAKRAKAEERFAAVKKLGEALKALQASEAERAFAPLTTATNELLQQMRSPFRLQVNSAADFGATDARRNGAYVAFWSLSDAERACVGAAMALALVRLSKSPWPALVMDGLEKMDPPTLEGFLNGVMAAFAAGWLSNFVGAHVAGSSVEIQHQGVAVHWMPPGVEVTFEEI